MRSVGLDQLGQLIHYFAELVETHRLADIAIHSAAGIFPDLPPWHWR
jgi:hypothetical protein